MTNIDTEALKSMLTGLKSLKVEIEGDMRQSCLLGIADQLDIHLKHLDSSINDHLKRLEQTP